MWRVARRTEWRREPFPHAIVDGVLDEAALADALAVVEDEGVERYVGDLFAFDATAPEPRSAAMQELRARFAAELCPVVGRGVVRADMRAYAYRAGDHLLPHTDHREGLGRVVAYAYYLPSPEPPVGGELELFAGVASAVVIEPRANRLVLFEVGDASLHQVREVMSGLRLSIAGWFY